MKLAGRQLRDTEIRAPFDGYVEKRLVNLGELVKAQMPVMAIVRLDPLKVIAEIPEKMAPWITDGQAVELRVDALPGPDLRRQGVAHQPGGQHLDPRVSRSKRSCPTPTRCSSRARSPASTSRAARSTTC